MFGNAKIINLLRQKYVYSSDYKHRYLLTEIILFGKRVSKSMIEV